MAEVMAEVEECIMESVEIIQNFIEKTTGQKASHEEIAGALKRYFVLREIGEHIRMVRENPES